MIFTFEEFNEARLADIMNIKASNDKELTTYIDNEIKRTFDFSEKLIKAIYLDNGFKKDVIWNDTAEHSIKQRIKDRTSFKTIDEFNQTLRKVLKDISNRKYRLRYKAKYSIYLTESNISIILYNNYASFNIRTIMSGRHGIDCEKIIEIFA